MTRVSSTFVSVCLALSVTAGLVSVATIAVEALMNWGGLWAFVGSHKFLPVFYVVIVLNNCVVLPIVILQRRRAERQDEPERFTPLKRQPLKAPRAL
jgi:hypothetical protein